LYDVQTLFEPVTTALHHISRFKFYAEAHRGPTAELKQHAVAHQDTFLVDSFLECRQVNNQWEILVHWQGFERAEATWEPLTALQTDVPVLLKKAIDTEPHPSFRALKTFLAARPTP